MKNPTTFPFSAKTISRHIAPAGLAVLLLALPRPANAQYALQAGSDYLNMYFYDGYSAVGGTDPTPFTVTPAAPGTPLTSYTWLTTSTTPGGPVPFGSYNSGSMSSSYASAQVSYQQGSLFAGSNSLSQSSISPVGTSLQLNNTGSGVAQLRLDWTASYTYTGPNGAFVPDVLLVNFSGAFSTFALMAGQEEFSVNSGPVVTATLPAGGDPSNPYPAIINPGATFWGYNVTTPYNATVGGVGGPLTINSGNTLTVSGFIDLLVDPGTAQLNILAVPEPGAAALSLLGGLGMLLGVRREKRPKAKG
jgi:hypothetical protein